MTPKQLAPYLQHKHNCIHRRSGQQYSKGLDGQPVDCDCGLIKMWERLVSTRNKDRNK